MCRGDVPPRFDPIRARPYTAAMSQSTHLRDRTVSANGLHLHYVEWGDPAGRPLVLLHGITGHARTWDRLAADLAHVHRGDTRRILDQARIGFARLKQFANAR